MVFQSNGLTPTKLREALTRAIAAYNGSASRRGMRRLSRDASRLIHTLLAAMLRDPHPAWGSTDAEEQESVVVFLENLDVYLIALNEYSKRKFPELAGQKVKYISCFEVYHFVYRFFVLQDLGGRKNEEILKELRCSDIRKFVPGRYKESVRVPRVKASSFFVG